MRLLFRIYSETVQTKEEISYPKEDRSHLLQGEVYLLEPQSRAMFDLLEARSIYRQFMVSKEG